MSIFGSLIQRLMAQSRPSVPSAMPQGIPAGMMPNAALGGSPRPAPINPQGLFNLGQLASQAMTPAAPQSPAGHPGGFAGINPQIAQMAMGLLQQSKAQPMPWLQFQQMRGGIR